MTARERQGPLSGLRVVDFSRIVSGGFATSFLGDFGADVVSVEHPNAGDPVRDWPMKTEDGVSLSWKSLGRNKRCVTLDLRRDAGRAVAYELVEDADVLFENFRPGTMEAWGMSPSELRAVEPELVVVRLSGYGQTGPKSSKPGFGTVAEGVSGWAHANGFPDREPLLPPISLAGLTAAQFAVMGALMAVFERDVGSGGSGEGQVVDVSLMEPLWRLFFGDVEAYDRFEHVRERTGNRHPNAAPRNVYETEDGYVTLAASNDKTFERVAAAIEEPELLSDPRFADAEARVANVEALDAVIEDWTRRRTTEEAIDVLESHDAIVGPVYDVSDVFADAQFDARDDVVEVDDPEVGALRTHGVVPKFSRTPGEVEFLGPRHGEHNEEVYKGELGMSDETFDELDADDVI